MDSNILANLVKANLLSG